MNKLSRPVLASVAVLTAAVMLSACGSSNKNSANNSANSHSANAGVAHAKAQVARYSKPTGVPTAGPPIKGGISSLKGKKIWWIADSTEIPYFAAVVQGAKAAAAAAGVKIEVCNGNFVPTDMAGCIDDAINEGAAGIVGDGFNISQVQQAVNSAVAHHIPYVQGDLNQKAGNDKVAYVWNNSYLESTLAAASIIADSKGKANLLLIRQTDSPSTLGFINQGGLPELHKYCSGCHITIIQTNAQQLSGLTSEVSAALERHPGIDHIYAEFDLEMPSVTSALQSLNKKIDVYSTTAQLSGLQAIKAGKFQVADAGMAPGYMGWAGIDQLLRMMRGQKPNDQVPMPVRLFNKSNINSLTLNNANFVNGSWYGATGFEKMFTRLWSGK